MTKKHRFHQYSRCLSCQNREIRCNQISNSAKWLACLHLGNTPSCCHPTGFARSVSHNCFLFKYRLSVPREEKHTQPDPWRAQCQHYHALVNMRIELTGTMRYCAIIGMFLSTVWEHTHNISRTSETPYKWNAHTLRTHPLLLTAPNLLTQHSICAHVCRKTNDNIIRPSETVQNKNKKYVWQLYS